MTGLAAGVHRYGGGFDIAQNAQLTECRGIEQRRFETQPLQLLLCGDCCVGRWLGGVSPRCGRRQLALVRVGALSQNRHKARK